MFTCLFSKILFAYYHVVILPPTQCNGMFVLLRSITNTKFFSIFEEQLLPYFLSLNRDSLWGYRELSGLHQLV